MFRCPTQKPHSELGPKQGTILCQKFWGVIHHRETGTAGSYLVCGLSGHCRDKLPGAGFESRAGLYVPGQSQEWAWHQWSNLTCVCVQRKRFVVFLLFPLILLTFPKRQILESSKLKEFADDNFKVDENGRKFSKWIEKTEGKGEIARYEQFLLFTRCFWKGL